LDKKLEIVYMEGVVVGLVQLPGLTEEHHEICLVWQKVSGRQSGDRTPRWVRTW